MDDQSSILSQKLDDTLKLLEQDGTFDKQTIQKVSSTLQECKKFVDNSKRSSSENLVNQEHILRAIIDNIPDYIFVKDLNRRHVLNNKEVCEDLYGGMSEEETLGTTVFDIFEESAAREYDEDDKRVIESGIPIINRKEASRTPDGRLKWFLTTKVPLRDQSNDIQGVVGIAKDITDSYYQDRDQKIISDTILALNKHDVLVDSLEEVLKILCKNLKMEAGEVWTVGNYSDKLNLKAGWSDSLKILNEFIKVESFEDLTKGLPIETFQAHKILAWYDLPNHDEFQRSKQAKKFGLKTGIGIPIIVKKEAIGVITLFSTSITLLEDRLNELFRKISLQVGLDIERKRSIDELNNLFKSSPDLMALVGIDGRFRKVNNAFNKVLGYSHEEMTSSPFMQFVHPEDILATENQFKKNQKGSQTDGFVNRFRTKSGDYKWIRWYSSDWLENDGFIFAYGHDITDLKNTNFELLKFKNILERSKDGVTMLSLDTGARYSNDVFQKMTGYSNQELTALDDIGELFEDQKLAKDVRNQLMEGKYWRGDVRLINKKGDKLELFFSGGPVIDNSGKQIASFGIFSDISDRKQYEKILQDSLSEKEALLSEVHHRVKNNLAVVAGMMELQLMSDEDPGLHNKLSDSINRIKSIASIHEQLYQNKSFSKLNLSKSIHQLITSIIDMLNSDQEIVLDFNTVDIMINVNQGIPCSLIVNEVTTNILKHAFIDRSEGKITVELEEVDNHINLRVKDNGVGLPADFDPKAGESLGLKLIDILTQQLEGKNEFTSDGVGTTFKLQFEKK